MTQVSQEVSALARENASVILRRLASIGQTAVAEAVGVSESTVSRWKDGEIDRLSVMLAFLGLRLVGATDQHVPPERLRALLELAGDGIAAMKGATR